MSDPVLEVAQVLTPFLAAGADGAIAEMTRQAGAGGAAAVRRVLDQIRDVVPSDADAEQTAAALRSALVDKRLSELDLSAAAKAIEVARINQKIQVKGNAYIGNTIRIDGGGSFQG